MLKYILEANTIFQSTFWNNMADASLPPSPITLLMQRYQASGLEPEFRVRRIEGADHSPIFEASIEVLCDIVFVFNHENSAMYNVHSPVLFRWLRAL